MSNGWHVDNNVCASVFAQLRTAASRRYARSVPVKEQSPTHSIGGTHAPTDRVEIVDSFVVVLILMQERRDECKRICDILDCTADEKKQKEKKRLSHGRVASVLSMHDVMRERHNERNG